jgi:hypothetical protein
MLLGVTRDVHLYVLCLTDQVWHVGLACLSEDGKSDRSSIGIEGLSVERMSCMSLKITIVLSDSGSDRFRPEELSDARLSGLGLYTQFSSV